MIIQCDNCRTKFRLDDSQIKPNGVRVRCTKCQNVFVATLPPPADEVRADDILGPSDQSPVRDDEAAAWGAGGGDEGAAAEGGEASRGAEQEAGGATFEGLDFSLGVDRSGAGGADEADEAEEGGEAVEDEAPGELGVEGPEDVAEAVADADEAEGVDEAAEAEGAGDQTPVAEEASGAEEAVEGEETAGEEQSLGAEEPAGDEAEAAGEAEVAEGAEGPVDEGLDSEPQEDFDLSFAPEGETEGPGPETAAGDEDTTEAAAEAASEADTAPEGPAGEPGESAAAPEAPPDEAPSEEAAAGEAPGPGEEEPPRSGFDAVYGMGDSTGAATQGQAVAEAGEGAGDKEKKVIPITVGVKKSDESAVRVPDFSEVFSHVISKDDIFAHGAGEGGEEERGPEEAAPVRRREAGPKKPSSARLGLLVAGLIIILGGAGLYASGIIETVTSSIAPGPARVRSVSIEKLSGRVMENVSAGRLFAIEAVVKNRTDEPQEIKTVRGTLYDKSGTRLAGRTVSPGRVLSPGDLRSLSRAEIERHFKDSSGGTIPPRGIVPVMVVFTEIPPGVGEYGLDIVR